MPTLIKPITSCNLKCSYCFQNDQRDVGNFTDKSQYDLDLIIKSINQLYKETKGKQVLHGGEILLLPLNDLERLLEVIHTNFGKTWLQTNGVLLTTKHVELFKKYNTDISISCDGPNKLNRIRTRVDDKKIDHITKKIMDNIKILCEAGLRVGVISVISKSHIENDMYTEFQDWILELENIGVKGGRMNLLNSNDKRIIDEFQLSNDEALDFYIKTAKWLLNNPTLNWCPFREIIDNLLDIGTPNCVYEKCDPLSTGSVLEILSEGEVANCSKLATDGIPYLANYDQPISDIRYEQLYQLPKEDGGCKDCTYWTICHGHCPGEAEEGDWRRKSKFCEVWYGLYDYYYNTLKAILPNIVLKPDQNFSKKKHEVFNPFSKMQKEIVGNMASSWRCNQNN
tara:strand:+ start:137 stop:1327 length:1191 start_codon:yes stop_codon:yes gene_type:complete